MNDQQYYREILIEQAARLQYQPHRLYVPIGKAEEFANYVGSGEYTAVAFSAANGIGKTTIAIQMLAHLMWPVGSPYFQQPLFKKWPFLKKGRIVSEPNTIKETIIPMMREIFPRDKHGDLRWKEVKGGKHHVSTIVTDTGWEVTIMSMDQEVKEFESANLGFVWIDEPPPEPIFTANSARLRGKGVVFITATPLKDEGAWMYDSFIGDKVLAKKKKRIGVEATIWDASVSKGVRGFYTDEQIANIIAQYSDPDEIDARIYGRPAHLQGLVYKMYDQRIHLIKPFDINPRDYVVAMALDPHPQEPHAVTWMAVDRENRKIIVDELFINCETEELVKKIFAIEQRGNYRIVRRIADPSAFVEDQRYGFKHELLSMAKVMKDLGLQFLEGSKKRHLGTQTTKDALTYVETNGVLIKPPELYLFDTCTRTDWEFRHWVYSKWKGKTALEKKKRGKPVDKDDHMMENTGRLLLEDIKFEEMQRPIASPVVGHPFVPANPVISPYQSRHKQLDPYGR